ncbi:DUF3857 domain-containing protein [Flavobacterium sp.]|uniref:DUF3857 domain-containing protein n=1 Tax=Flavobacterium sp. TaxID=239 RepID=UPI00286E9A7A|nr:DUF3857 domain-containing protein [Flavobacterium sp.]
MKIKSLIGLLFLLSFIKGSAQKLEFGKVSIAELEEKFHPIDTSAVAAILFKKGKTVFEYHRENGFSIKSECTFRIKIYKKEGLSWANFEVPYYVGYENYNDDSVEFSNGVTYNLENGTIVKTKLNSEGKFKNNINKYWNKALITLPNAKVGSIIEFKYTLKSEDIVKFPDLDFQYEIPVKQAEYTTEIPGFFVYKALAKGFLEVKTESKIAPGYLTFADEFDRMKSNSVTFQQINNKYTAYNIPALKTEPFVDNIQNYRLAIKNELEKTQFYEEPVKDYAQTWEGVAKTIYKDKEFGDELNARSYFEQDLKTIIKENLSENEKVDVIFKFVQHKMNWNKLQGYTTRKGVKKAYLENTGNTAEINFILISMLNYAGIIAKPVLLSTVDNGIPVFPNRTGFNHVIAAVEIDNKRVLLDATNKYTLQDIIPLENLNWNGRLIRQDGTSEEINLLPTKPSKTTMNMMVSVDATGKINGKIRIQKTDYDALTFREKYTGINKENYLEKLENQMNGILISDYSIDNSSDNSKPIIENFTFNTENQCEIIGGKLYINPLLFYTQTRNPFEQNNRQMPIYFGYPKQEKYNINIEIPEGYIVESMPKPLKLTTGENVGMFLFNISTEGNKIQIQVTEEMNKAMVSANFYDALKSFYQQIVDKQNEKIVLKKI